MTAALLAILFLAPSDSLLVEVRLSGVGAVVVEAVLDADSTLHLPTGEVATLFGTSWTPAATFTLADLTTAFPLLLVHWIPRELQIVVDDPQGVLPASRRQREQAQRRAYGGPGATVTTSGPYVAFAADERERYVADVGYSWRGVLAVAARKSSTFGTTWNLGAAPSPHVFASVSGAHVGVHRAPQITNASARLAFGSTWLSASWTPTRWDIDALVTKGPVSVFASSRDVFVITIRGLGADLQVGRRAGVSAFHVSVGSFRSSPFVFPTTY